MQRKQFNTLLAATAVATAFACTMTWLMIE